MKSVPPSRTAQSNSPLFLIAFYREEEVLREAPSSLQKTELRKASISKFSLSW